jgi:hypothetical protein
MAKTLNFHANTLKKIGDFAAAREELGVLERLASGVLGIIAALRVKRRFDGEINQTELAIRESNYSQLATVGR